MPKICLPVWLVQGPLGARRLRHTAAATWRVTSGALTAGTDAGGVLYRQNGCMLEYVRRVRPTLVALAVAGGGAVLAWQYRSWHLRWGATPCVSGLGSSGGVQHEACGRSCAGTPVAASSLVAAAHAREHMFPRWRVAVLLCMSNPEINELFLCLRLHGLVAAVTGKTQHLLYRLSDLPALN